ncbi:MlaE family ABC transporter permease [Brachyspira hampsonii]|uniref:ABC transporter permease n=1 Tax=Brachyspira hampsonii 30446 TaxID=1289135 RepID=A0A2U4FLZ3_9SPIR|nr:ABC transporter permease [Brachyspira hampsonii]EKV56093.1 ABC transporter permease [Brachyspira hampsonii 30446]MBW5389089.1 ABC transporter permease [Brachyspira hampsonii]MBW5394034.1 ABC transporter permease [Brachyspira hampsonii]OEJ18064.1 ABC transporter permease [Brachyspira hampsonii]
MELFDMKIELRKGVKNKITYFLATLGEFAFLIIEVFRYTFRSTFSFKLLKEQIIRMGVDSFVVAAVTVLCTGMVMSLQIAVVLDTVLKGISQFVGSMVGKAMVKELSPMLLALIFAGRVGSSVTAEIGTMQVSEQLDALKTLYTNPIEYVAVPRFWAAVISLPMLTVSADVIGVLGGAVVTVFVLHSDPMHYFDRAISVISVGDFIGSLIKSTIFGAEVMIISCFYGFRTSGGAEGVGKATTTSVVYSFMIILITDYILVSILGMFGM